MFECKLLNMLLVFKNSSFMVRERLSACRVLSMFLLHQHSLVLSESHGNSSTKRA